MVRKILWYLLAALIVLLIIIWFVSGGIGKVKAAAQNLTPFWNFAGSGGITLPWAVPIPQGPDISGLAQESGASQNSQAQNFGNPSPLSLNGEVTLDAEGAVSNNPETEYLIIRNEGGEPVDLGGFSLQSALSGARAYIPLGASSFRLGALNTQGDITLAPGGEAIVTTGNSPVGTSFLENECSGYLGQLQNYAPPIQTECPAPEAYAAQASQYGGACAQFVASLPSCTFPAEVPQGISQACAAYAQTQFSYNGCVQDHGNDPEFAGTTWRVYLSSPHELWGNGHDTIRLLDAQGQVVAVTSY